MEYDGWTRKLVSVLKEWGFEPTGNKATSHKKWRYEGPKTERRINIVVPAQVKNSSRAATIGSIKRSLRNAGASKEAIAEFNNFALGLIEAEATDPISELEEKLAAAITNEAALTAAKIAFQLAKAADDKNYVSSAISRREGEIGEATRKRELINKIDDLLLKRMQSMFNRHIEGFGPLSIGREGILNRERIKVNAEISNEFELSVDESFDILQHNHFRLYGRITGEAGKMFEALNASTGFNAVLDNAEEDELYDCYNGNDLYGFQAHGIHSLSEEDLARVLATIQSQQTMLALKGRLGPVDEDA